MTSARICDVHAALSRMDGDWETFRALVELFTERAPLDVADVRSAVAAQNGQALAHAAHRLKGAVLQFCAPSVLDTTRELEALGKAETLAQAPALVARLEADLDRLLAALQSCIRQGEPS